VGEAAQEQATTIAATAFAPLNAFLTRFVSAVREILGGNVVGVPSPGHSRSLVATLRAIATSSSRLALSCAARRSDGSASCMRRF